MDDRELLELAAKAAGLIAVDGVYLIARDSSGEPHEWNPLTDDGDALRLAVKLGMIVEAGANRAIVFHPSADESVTKVLEWYENHDSYAATRRAIVRAAAEIGKEQSNES